MQLRVRAPRGEGGRAAPGRHGRALRLESASGSCPGERPSTLPSAGEIASPLELGSTAIGQGRVLATTLQMASVAQTVANRGVRVLPTLLPARRGRRVRVTSPQVAVTLA